jgi:hypothetical protein
MRERVISDAEVELTLRAYDSELPAKHGRRSAYKLIAGRRIRVTFGQIANDIWYVWTVTANEVNRA